MSAHDSNPAKAWTLHRQEYLPATRTLLPEGGALDGLPSAPWAKAFVAVVQVGYVAFADPADAEDYRRQHNLLKDKTE